MKTNTSKNSAFDKIAEGVIYGNLGLFVGAGLSMAIMNKDEEPIALSWHSLLEKCADYFEINFSQIMKEGKSYPQISTDLCRIIAKSKNISQQAASEELKQVISDLTSLYPDSSSRTKFSAYFNVLNPKWIITTNYDTVIESVLTGVGHSLAPEDQLLAPAGRIPVYHLHGIRTNPSSIVITQEDYVSLFRPNQYRQQKLPLTIKESVTLLVGYGLGDFNVLTAFDWSRNVFENNSSSYPNGMIQLIHTADPNPVPYSKDGILVIEFKDLAKCFEEMCEYVTVRKTKARSEYNKLKKLETKYANPTEKLIEGFLENKDVRSRVLQDLKASNHYYINGFLELLSRALDQVWMEARKSGNFYQYDNYLCILLDIIENIEFASSPPALVQTISYGLDKVGYYVGPGYGEAHGAFRTWSMRGKKLPLPVIKELRNISKLNPSYHNIALLLKMIDK